MMTIYDNPETNLREMYEDGVSKGYLHKADFHNMKSIILRDFWRCEIEWKDHQYIGYASDLPIPIQNQIKHARHVECLALENKRLKSRVAVLHSQVLESILEDCANDPALLEELRPTLSKLQTLWEKNNDR